MLSLQSSLVRSRNAPHSAAADTAMGQDSLFHGEALSGVATTDSDDVTLPFFTHSSSSSFCGHRLLTKSTMFAFIIHFSEFLAARSWERDVQLHPEAAHHLLGARKKSNCDPIFYCIRTLLPQIEEPSPSLQQCLSDDEQ